MQGSKKRDDVVVKELHKEIERQGELIFQLRQENVSLRTQLENEKDMCQIYANRLQSLQSQFTSHVQALEMDDKDAFQNSAVLIGDGDGNVHDGVALTIRTQLQTQPSEGSGIDDFTCCSELEDSQIDAEVGGNGGCCEKTKAVKQRHGLFFQKGGSKQHRRNMSLRELQARTHCMDQFCSNDKPSISSPKACKQKKLSPVQRSAREDVADSLSRIGWTPTSLGQKLNLIKESYTQQTDVFDDDLRFMREVLSGLSRAPEMDIEVELNNINKDFKLWRKQFEESVRSLQASIRPTTVRRGMSLSPRKLESKRASGRKNTVTASIGKLFHRSTHCDLSCQEKMVSGAQ